jgi:hypothetical protein
MKGNDSFTPDQGFQSGYEEAKAMRSVYGDGGENNNEKKPRIWRYTTAM